MKKNDNSMVYRIGVVVALLLVVIFIIVFKSQGQKKESSEDLAEKPLSVEDSLAGYSLPKETVATESLSRKTSPGDGLAEEKGDRQAESTASLSEDVLAIVNGEEITRRTFNKQFDALSVQNKEYFKDDKAGFLEEVIVRQLLLQDARQKGIQEQIEYKTAVAQNPGQEEDIMINVLIRNMVAAVAVTESGLREFFENYKDQFPDKNYEAVKEQLRPMALQEKQRLTIEQHLNELKANAKIVRNEEWIKAQELLAADNPLSKALKMGGPVVADFGRGTCIPCKMMQPILEKLQKDYEGRASILILDVGEYASLSRKYGVRIIPTQIFFDTTGKEVYRHQGFMPEEDIVVQLKKMGVE